MSKKKAPTALATATKPPPPDPKQTTTTSTTTATVTATIAAPAKNPPKKPTVVAPATTAANNKAPPVKRGRGRPRKYPLGHPKSKVGKTNGRKSAAAKAKAVAAKAAAKASTATTVPRNNKKKLPMHNTNTNNNNIHAKPAATTPTVKTTTPSKRSRSGSIPNSGASIGGASVTEQDINDVMGMDALDSDSAFAASLLLSPQLSPGFTAELGFGSRGNNDSKSWMASPPLPENDLLGEETGEDSSSWNRPATGAYIPPATGFPMPNLEGTSLTNHHSPSKKVRNLLFRLSNDE